MANSFVKFYRLSQAAYDAQSKVDANGIYFITDKQKLIVGGVNYGMSSELIGKLEGAIDKVEFTSPNIIAFTNVKGDKELTISLPNATASGENGTPVAGLMSGDDKVILDRLNGTADTEGSVMKQVADALASAKSYTNTEIEKLDVTDNAVVGSYVSAVSETDGKIAVTRAELPTVAEIKSEGQAIIAVSEDKGVISATTGDIAAAHVTIADAGDHFTSTTVEAALEELYSQAGAGSKVTIDEAAGTEAGVLKVYSVKQGGKEVGKINIPKDLVVSSGSVVKGTWDGNTFTESESGNGTALKLVIANQTSPVYINTLDLVKDHTAGNGIAISDTNVVSIKVAEGNESFLTVDANGLKLSGVADHVASEIAKLDSTKASDTNAKAVVTVVEENGVITSVALEDKDIASAALLGTKADTSDNDTAFGRIAKEVADRTAAIEALDANVTSTGGSHVTVKVDEANGVITAVTVTESDIASASGLSDEIARAEAAEDKIEASVGLAADGSHITTTGNYTKNATTIAGEISALDAQVFTNTGAISTLKDNTVNGKKISGNPVLDGRDIALTGYSVDANGDLFAAKNTVNEAMKIIMEQLVWHEA